MTELVLMESSFLRYLIKDGVSTNVGPNAKEVLLEQAESEYNSGNVLHSIFYQVHSLFQSFQERFYQRATEMSAGKDNKAATVDQIVLQMSESEKEEFDENPFLQYVAKSLAELSNPRGLSASQGTEFDCNFLKDVNDPEEGMRKIESVCQEMPLEWTILHLCKGPRTETTFSMFPQIHESDAAIFLTIMRHARSTEYPTPVCLRFSGPEQQTLYEKFGCIVNRFKQCVKIDPEEWNTTEAKQFYWKLLGELNSYIALALADLKNFFFPWNFLFTGIPHTFTSNGTGLLRFDKIDEFCVKYQLETNERILLSLAALHAGALTDIEIDAICNVLTNSIEQKSLAVNLLRLFQNDGQNSGTTYQQGLFCHYPCILIIDERLDHFFWEEMNVQQEFCRVNSLQSLWRLFCMYKTKIHKGYLNVRISDGGCLLNPDNNLPKMEMRMRSFFSYWIPHWTILAGQKPTQEELFSNYFKRCCYVYAGHGSGLQYINGKNIAKHKIDCVVFLFGCDSSRLHSNGLYSELVGPHLYYHAALCPSLVGTLMPGLDANMDKVATEILSRWIAPKSTEVLPWYEIDFNVWMKEGTIKSKFDEGVAPTVASTPQYNIGSLCAILARVHQRIGEPKLYNTVPYVCRGLPVWNCDVENLPQ